MRIIGIHALSSDQLGAERRSGDLRATLVHASLDAAPSTGSPSSDPWCYRSTSRSYVLDVRSLRCPSCLASYLAYQASYQVTCIVHPYLPETVLAKRKWKEGSGLTIMGVIPIIAGFIGFPISPCCVPGTIGTPPPPPNGPIPIAGGRCPIPGGIIPAVIPGPAVAPRYAASRSREWSNAAAAAISTCCRWWWSRCEYPEWECPWCECPECEWCRE